MGEGIFISSYEKRGTNKICANYIEINVKPVYISKKDKPGWKMSEKPKWALHKREYANTQ